MAIYTVFNAAPVGMLPATFFPAIAGVVRDSFTPTSVTLTLPDGKRIQITGAGFTFSAAPEEAPTGGTIDSIVLYAPDFATQLAAFTGLSVGLADFNTAWESSFQPNLYAFLLGGNDTVNAGTQSDVLLAFDGDDTINGGLGDDFIDPGAGTDTIDGGGGGDTISYTSAYDSALITKGVTFDLTKTTILDPFGFTDTITSIERARGTRFADTFIGTTGDNRFEGLDGNDSFTGGAGQDRISYNRDAQFGGTKGVTVNLAAGTATDGFGASDSFTGIEQVAGTEVADNLTGGNTVLVGQSYDIFGLGGDDIITAGKHDLYAEPGSGADTITAGAGFDQVSYAEYTGSNSAVFNLATGTVQDPYGSTDTLIGQFEAARGTRNDDGFVGNSLNNHFRGLGGNDTIDGGAGLDRVRYDRDAQYGGAAGVKVNLAAGTATDGFGNTDTLVSIEEVQGTEQADTLTGGNTALTGGNVYTLIGGGGDDTLKAGSWDTILIPGAGNDTVSGGAGSDQVSYEEYGGANGAVVNLATGTVADPYGGTDTITGGIEGVRGTRNADALTGNASANYFRGLAGNDVIDGGGGTDQVRYDRDAANGGNGNISVDLALGTATDGFGNTDTLISIENARGSNNNDELFGDDNNNTFQGLSGADNIDGRGGQDTVDYSADTLGVGITGVIVDLGAGKATDGAGFTDTLTSIEGARGTAGADTLTGGATKLTGQAYELYGGGGNDTIASGGWDIYVEPGAGNDTISAGAGFDQISYSEYNGANGATINLATGVVNDPYGGTDTLVGLFEGARGTRNADTITGTVLNNQFRSLAGNDTIDGGDGLDRVRYDRDASFGGAAGVTVNLATGTATDGFGNTDTLISIEAVEGTAQADTLTGGDTDLGAGNAWELYGRGGDDILVGGAKAAYFEPGAGNDTITGGAGLLDQISYSDAATGLGVVADLTKGSLTDPWGNTDTFTGIEGLRGTSHGDTLTGDAIDNFFVGLDGADTIDGGAGIDTMRYDRDAANGGTAGVMVNLADKGGRDGFGSFDALINIENVRGTNATTGNTLKIGGVDTVFGDVFVGDAADNIFQGLGGNDYLDGGAGNDTADFSRDITQGGGAGVTVDLAAGTATDGLGSTDTLISIESVIGTGFADTIAGDAADNVFTGGLGNDTMAGGAGTDTAVFAGTRAEYEVRFDSVAGTVVVVGPDGVDTLSGVEQLRFSDRDVTALGVGGSPQHLVNVTFPVSPTNPVETSRFMIGSSYSGPVLGLTDEFVFPTPENINIASTLPNAFIRTGAGNDAISVVSGRNVIDAFTGSNFLTGGSGQDTFFLDARGGGSTWDTIVNFGVGDEVTLWGYDAKVSKDGLDKSTWYESDGVDPFKGLTIHAKLDGVNFGASITFAGLGFADRDSLVVSTGSVAGNDYLYITRV